MSAEVWVDQRVSQLLADQVQQGEEVSPGPCHREGAQVLHRVFEALANREIAARPGVTEGAAKASLQQLFQKTQVRTRSRLVRIALEGSLGTLRGR
jgi:two-component system nitrate/nitrite response regulator NarL